MLWFSSECVLISHGRGVASFFMNLCMCHSFFAFLHFEVVVIVSIHLTGLPQEMVISRNGPPQQSGQPSVRSGLAATMVPTGFCISCQMALTTQAISSPLKLWTQKPQRQIFRHFGLLYYLRN